MGDDVHDAVRDNSLLAVLADFDCGICPRTRTVVDRCSGHYNDGPRVPASPWFGHWLGKVIRRLIRLNRNTGKATTESFLLP